MAVYNIHAGHGAVGKGAIGAVGFINESVSDRAVKDEVIFQLRALGHVVYDCTEDCGTATKVLDSIIEKCNAHTVEIDVSIHFNSGAKDPTGNGKTTGVESWIYKGNSKPDNKAWIAATNITNTIAAECGYKNRGVKESKDLRFLRQTKAPAVLVECCFVDDKDDAQIFDVVKMASAIVFGLTGQRYVAPQIAAPTPEEKAVETPIGDPNAIHRVQVGAYKNKANADALRDKLKAAGFDAVVVKA